MEREWLIGTNPEIDAFIEAQPSSENAEIMRYIRQLLKQWLPELTEKTVMKTPFFYFHGRVCYFRPHPEGVDWSFCHGMELPQAPDYFMAEGGNHLHKVVGRILISNSSSPEYERPLKLLTAGKSGLNWDEARALFFEAAERNRRKATAATRKKTRERLA